MRSPTMNPVLRGGCLAALVWGFCILSGNETAFAAERPNILLIVGEDHGPELGCYGNPYVTTPVLDRLASEGVRFQNAFVPQAGCSQSRAAFLTGLYPHQNGQIGLATWKCRMYREDTPNLFRNLKEAGYRTGIIGKVHVNPESAFPFDFQAIPSSNFLRKNINAYAEQANTFIRDGNAPFFLSVNYPDAHRPFLQQIDGRPEKLLTEKDVQPPSYSGINNEELRATTADYYNSVNRLDSLIGDLLEVLNKSGKADNTLVIYLGDHGADLPRGKRTSYEGGLRIPLIIRWPRKANPGHVCEEFVSTLDLMPTLLAAAGAHPVADLPGLNLLPLMQGEHPEWRRYLFTEYQLHSPHDFYPQRTVRDSRYKLIHNLLPGERNPGFDATMDAFYPDTKKTLASHPENIRQVYERLANPPEFELYDLQSDPNEFNDLANDAAHAAVLSELQSELLRWRQDTHDPLLNPENVARLKAEVYACYEDGKPVKEKLSFTYPDYFFTTAKPVQKGKAAAESR